MEKPFVIRKHKLSEDIARAKIIVKNKIKAAYADGPRPAEGILCRASTISVQRKPRTIVTEETSYKANQKFAEAPVFFLGGLDHDDFNLLGTAISHLGKLIPIEHQHRFGSSLAIFCPQSSRFDRVDEAYDWNEHKIFPSKSDGGKLDSLTPDMQEFADRLWKNRFLNTKGKLRPAANFQGFSFITYSIGGRLAFIVENLLRIKLREAIRARNEGDISLQAENELIQKYFDKCKNFCIGHAVDWEDMPRGQPGIPKVFLMGKDDNGPIPRESFWNFMHDRTIEGPAESIDISDQFNAPLGRDRLVILNNNLLHQAASENSTPNSHGIGDYARALIAPENACPAIKEFVAAINTAIFPAKSNGHRRAGGSAAAR